mmetsp:Transcript_41837/g.133487  ORF Transcript_41837/g.133487 Transcript_41837/m.133487 type:complete len:203 (-) Transcript_41837:303-911(-)
MPSLGVPPLPAHSAASPPPRAPPSDRPSREARTSLCRSAAQTSSRGQHIVSRYRAHRWPVPTLPSEVPASCPPPHIAPTPPAARRRRWRRRPCRSAQGGFLSHLSTSLQLWRTWAGFQCTSPYTPLCGPWGSESPWVDPGSHSPSLATRPAPSHHPRQCGTHLGSPNASTPARWSCAAAPGPWVSSQTSRPSAARPRPARGG